jgi:hypothetical protein
LKSAEKTQKFVGRRIFNQSFGKLQKNYACAVDFGLFCLYHVSLELDKQTQVNVTRKDNEKPIKALRLWAISSLLEIRVARFFLVQHTKTGKIYQIITTFTKWLLSVKIYQHLRLQDPPKFTQIWIFGLKIYHLATLLEIKYRNTKTGFLTLTTGVSKSAVFNIRVSV